MNSYQLHITGEWVASRSGQTATVYSPYTGESKAAIEDGNCRFEQCL